MKIYNNFIDGCISSIDEIIWRKKGSEFTDYGCCDLCKEDKFSYWEIYFKEKSGKVIWFAKVCHDCFVNEIKSYE